MLKIAWALEYMAAFIGLAIGAAIVFATIRKELTTETLIAASVGALPLVMVAAAELCKIPMVRSIKAQHNLGVMYYYGQGVTLDFVQAHMWLSLATAQGNKKASERRDIVAELMTPNQIAEAQRMAREWMAKHPR